MDNQQHVIELISQRKNMFSEIYIQNIFKVCDTCHGNAIVCNIRC